MRVLVATKQQRVTHVDNQERNLSVQVRQIVI